MPVCVAHRCPEEAGDGPLCQAHQLRLDSGGGLSTSDEPTYGDPSGHGVHGQVDVNEYGIKCHECGRRYPKLGHHLRGHKISVADYRTKHGLTWRPDLKLALPPGVVAKKRSSRAKRPRKQHWRPLTEEEVTALRQAMLTSREDLRAIIEKLQADRVTSGDIAEAMHLPRNALSARYPRADWGKRYKPTIPDEWHDGD